MAKALRALLLAGTLLFLLIGESLGTAAAAGQAAIQAQGKFVASDRIVISGSITSGEGQWITLAVHEPSGKLFYINQTTSGAGGQFTFELPRGEQKTYTFSVNGSGADKYTGTIVESTGGGPGDPPVVYPGNGETGVSDVWRVSSEQLDRLVADAVNQTVSLVLAPGIKEVILPSDAAAKLNGLALVFRQGDLAIRFDKLSAFLAGLSDDQLDGAAIVFSAERTDDGKAPGNFNANLSFAGDSYLLKLFVRTQSGAELPLSGRSAIVELPYRGSADPVVLGLYRYNTETASWTYMGGDAIAAKGVVAGGADSFNSGQYAIMSFDKRFADVPDTHWASQAIRGLAARSIVKGVSEAQYEPARKVTRAEFAALLVRLLKLEASELPTFADVRVNDWFAKDVAAAFKAVIIKGKTDRIFAPGDVITREEMAVMLARAYPVAAAGAQTRTSFKDERDISGWALEAVQAMASRKLLVGDRQGSFNPRATLTRAEAAQAIYNLQQQLVKDRAQTIN